MINSFKLIAVLLLINFINFASAQLPVQLELNGSDITNTVQFLPKDNETGIHVSNTGSTSMDVTIEVTGIELPVQNGPRLLVCWGLCFLVTSPTVLGTVSIPAGQTNTDDFHFNYISAGYSGRAKVTFHIYEQGYPDDYVSLVMDTEIQTDIPYHNFSGIKAFPNPVIDELSISNIHSVDRIVLTDMAGRICRTISTENHHELKIFCANYKLGIYFLYCYEGNKVLYINKLVKL